MVFKLIRSVLGLDSSDPSDETDVTVEGASGGAAAAGTDASAPTDAGTAGEPDAGTPAEAAAAGTDAAASTGSMTEEPPDAGAAEPAEAAGPTPGDAAGTAVDVEDVSGIGPAYAQRLGDAGVETVSDLLAADPDDLAAETDLSAKRIQRWQERAEEA